MACVVGLIVTDGCLSMDGKRVSLVSCDLDLLRTYATILETNNRIAPHSRSGYASTKVRHLFLGDRLLHAWLVGIGVTPRKTARVGAIDVPDMFFPDFLRGHLDGDGSIVAYVDRYHIKVKPSYVYQRLYVRFLSASRVHIEWLQRKILLLLGIGGYVTMAHRARHKAPLYTLHFAKREAIALLRWIYYAPDVPCLARKRAIAEPFLTGEFRSFRHPRALGNFLPLHPSKQIDRPHDTPGGSGV